MTDTKPRNAKREAFDQLTDHDKRHRVCRFLCKLGHNDDEIATSFWDGQHAGLRCHPTINSVSDYLEKWTGTPSHLVTVYPNLVSVDGVMVLLPDPLQRFMRGYDQGFYPHLVVNG